MDTKIVCGVFTTNDSQITHDTEYKSEELNTQVN